MSGIVSRRLKRTYPYHTLTAYEHSTLKEDGETSVYWYSFEVDKTTKDPLCPLIFVNVLKQTIADVRVEPFRLDFLNPNEIPQGILFYEEAALTAQQMESDIKSWQNQ